jgi:hypothetical protein
MEKEKLLLNVLAGRKTMPFNGRNVKAHNCAKVNLNRQKSASITGAKSRSSWHACVHNWRQVMVVAG